jgi:hypothetical protein
MKIRAGIVTTVALVIVLGAWAFAQLLQDNPVQTPITLSGGDIGFRVEATRGETVVGKLVVRLNGKWVDAQLGGGPLRLSAR